jgi:predicted dehydrogenase
LVYKLGIVGVGHWFEKLHTGAKMVGGIDVTKAVGTRPFQQHAKVLQKCNIGGESYYMVDKETGKIPDAFFDGIDVVQIADPNALHASQAMDALGRGKKVVIEKTFAVTKPEYSRFIDYVRSSKKQQDVYLHLHYCDKMPTRSMKEEAAGYLGKFGRVKEVYATFFESANRDDFERRSLFDIINGGLFMDWIHPMEVLYYVFGASFGHITELNPYMTNPSYDKKNPTGLNVTIGVSGENFAGGALMHINIAKGVDKKFDRKSMCFVFESGDYVRLTYSGSEAEFTTSARGKIELGSEKDMVFTDRGSEMLMGENSSETYIREIVALCSGEREGFNTEEISNLFAPQWEYQSMVSGKQLINNRKMVEKFLADGLRYG